MENATTNINRKIWLANISLANGEEKSKLWKQSCQTKTLNTYTQQNPSTRVVLGQHTCPASDIR